MVAKYVLLYFYFPFLLNRNADISSKVDLIKRNVKSYPNFPKKGVTFRDIFSVLSNPEASEALWDILFYHVNRYRGEIEAVCGLDSRGFLFAPTLALHLGVPFVPIRKRGKLPGAVMNRTYETEYSSATFEIQKDAIKRGWRVLVVDDLIATGGSLRAACQLISCLGAKVHHGLVVIELPDLRGRCKVPVPVQSIVRFSDDKKLGNNIVSKLISGISGSQSNGQGTFHMPKH